MASYISPAIRDKFETLSVDLKNCILERNVHLESLPDLIKVLEDIVAESEGRSMPECEKDSSLSFLLSLESFYVYLDFILK